MKKQLFICILGVIWKNSLAQIEPFTCDPAIDCATSGVAGAIVPDPDDCHKFYVCISVGGEIVPSTSSVLCPDGEYFDQGLRSCGIEDTPGVCGHNTCASKTCSRECPSPFIVVTTVADRFNCSIYYICGQPGPIQVSCPTNLPYFDGTACVASSSKCCDFCTAYCTAPGIQIVDPCDCTSYYICFNEGPALPNFRFTCDSGTYYDEPTATCITGSCQSFCSNCGTINPTTVPAESTTTTSSGATLTSSEAISTTTSSEATLTSSEAISTTTTTNSNGCQSLESFTCPSNGNFAMCPFCNNKFFHCQNGEAEINVCTGSSVFNPTPEYPYCLNPSNCPYP